MCDSHCSSSISREGDISGLGFELNSLISVICMQGTRAARIRAREEKMKQSKVGQLSQINPPLAMYVLRTENFTYDDCPNEGVFFFE